MRRIMERYLLSSSVETIEDHNMAKKAVIYECGCDEKDILIEVNNGVAYIMTNEGGKND